VALVVGPEGFAYEPLFRGAGLPTVAVNVPESEPGGPRTVHTPPGEDLGAVGGRRVLVVEDDVCTGATLRAVLGALPVRPASVGLYLGSPAGLRKLTPVPPEVSQVHASAGEHDEAVDEFLWFLEERDMGAFRGTCPGRVSCRRRSDGRRGLEGVGSPEGRRGAVRRRACVREPQPGVPCRVLHPPCAAVVVAVGRRQHLGHQIGRAVDGALGGDDAESVRAHEDHVGLHIRASHRT